MKLNLRLASFLLALVIILGVFVSCAPVGSEVSTADPSTDTSASEIT